MAVYTTLSLTLLSIYGCFISAVVSTGEECPSSPPYSVNGSHQGCCIVNGSTCGVSCYLETIHGNTTVNITFPCFDLMSITLRSKDVVLSLNAGMVLVELLTNDSSQGSESTSQDVLTLNSTFTCVTSLRLVFITPPTSEPVSIELSSNTCNATTTAAAATATVTAEATKSECSGDCNEVSRRPTTSEDVSKSDPLSMVTTDTTSSREVFESETTQAGEERERTTGSSPGSAGITTAIISATGTIASLLLLIAVAIIILTLVLVTRRKKMLFSRDMQNDTIGNNYVTISTGRDPQSFERGPHYPESDAANLITEEHALTEIHPRGWDAYPSLPRPPADPGLATIEEWVKAKESMAPDVTNVHYASSLSIASNSNMSEPPNYESIQDIQRKYFLPNEGVPGGLNDSTKLRTRSLQDCRVTHRDHSRAATVDRIRIRQDRTNKTKMAQVLEEAPGCRCSPLTTALTAERFPYSDATAKVDNTGEETSREHSVNNDLYEAISKGGADPEYLVIGENYYENSDLGPPGSATMYAQELDTEDRSHSKATSPLLDTSPTYTTMSSIAPTLPLGGAQELESRDTGSQWGTASDQDEVPEYSKVKKTKQRTSDPCDGDNEAPPIPPYLAEISTGDHEGTTQAPKPPNQDVGSTVQGGRKAQTCYSNTDASPGTATTSCLSPARK